MDYLWIIVGTLAVIGVWLLLCQLKVIPDPYAKWSLAIAAAIGTLGIAILVGRMMGGKDKGEARPDPKPTIVTEKGPTEEEVKDQDKAIEDQDKALEAAKGEANEIDDKLNEIDGAEKADMDTVDSGGAVDGPTAERLRRMQDGPGEG